MCTESGQNPGELTGARGRAGRSGPVPVPTGDPSSAPYSPYAAKAGASGPEPCPDSGVSWESPALIALRAAEYADVCVVGRLAEGEAGASRVLEVAAPDRDALPGARPVVLRGTMADTGEAAGGEPRWLPLVGIVAVAADGTSRDLAELEEPARIEVLRRAGLDAVERLAAEGGETTGLTVEQRCRVRTAEEEALVPLAQSCGDLARTRAHRIGTDVDGLRRVQERCRDLYGRLEPERALAWALEELGELAQAMRRGESSVRVEEELGQVLVWAFCLANITRTDAAHAFAKAFSAELARQLRTHGRVRPYRREVLPC
ncbi:MazG nucleotide pyrophosphohydrolase domain-containing protein [Streptomyces sp. NPDC038707]|uniref:MazG nucleotide pyrophosphohydrolase domain-containing protein n=1 Tax=Streptomyces sp. NPDC038707 TaxID=3154329 RepID=UPI0033FB480C